MTSKAAIEGIAKNGLAWKKRLPIKSFIPYNAPNLPNERIEPTRRILVKYLNKWKDRVGVPEEIIEAVQFSLNQDDLADALDRLYDWADYERVLIS